VIVSELCKRTRRRCAGPRARRDPAAAYFTSLRDLRQKVVQISALAVGLVAATTAGVAMAAH
jgi:hypothetical protein